MKDLNTFICMSWPFRGGDNRRFSQDHQCMIWLSAYYFTYMNHCGYLRPEGAAGVYNGLCLAEHQDSEVVKGRQNKHFSTNGSNGFKNVSLLRPMIAGQRCELTEKLCEQCGCHLPARGGARNQDSCQEGHGPLVCLGMPCSLAS